jgi:hypothetical protein
MSDHDLEAARAQVRDGALFPPGVVAQIHALRASDTSTCVSAASTPASTECEHAMVVAGGIAGQLRELGYDWQNDFEATRSLYHEALEILRAVSDELGSRKASATSPPCRCYRGILERPAPSSTKVERSRSDSGTRRRWPTRLGARPGCHSDAGLGRRHEVGNGVQTALR